jgi:hypothetical protein
MGCAYPAPTDTGSRDSLGVVPSQLQHAQAPGLCPAPKDTGSRDSPRAVPTQTQQIAWPGVFLWWSIKLKITGT